MTAERNLGFFLFTFERKKMKSKFLEALRPCCSFSYQIFREWISALAFYDESQKDEVLKEIRIDGTMSRKGWNLLLIDNARSETLDLREVREKWLGDCNSLNCEQWESLINELLYREEIQTNLYYGGTPKFYPFASKVIQYITGLDENKSNQIAFNGSGVIIKKNVQIDDYFTREDFSIEVGVVDGDDLGNWDFLKDTRFAPFLDDIGGAVKFWIE